MKNSKKWITITGAREHNLKNITVSIPKDSFTVITGPSGSGKSSLALDILYTEGKRRYMESLSSYARQFLGIPKKPDVDDIQGLCPAIAIEQKTVGSNPRSTVGTITEIYDYLRVLYARIGQSHCFKCQTLITSADPSKITQMIIATHADKEITISAPLAQEKKGEFVTLLEQFFALGYYRFTIDGQKKVFRTLEEIKNLGLKKTHKHTIELMLDTVLAKREEASRIEHAISKSFELAQQVVHVVIDQQLFRYSGLRACLTCGISCPELEPRLFSFNSPLGACTKCHGLGVTYGWGTDSWALSEKWHDKAEFLTHERACTDCSGQRLNKSALAVLISAKNIFQMGELSIQDSLFFFNSLKLDQEEAVIAKPLLHEIRKRLEFLSNVGLGYLTLNRTARTLSGGEGQRIKLATQIGSALTGVVYILDEPSIGLHQRDNDKLIKSLHQLRDQGNTVVVVEHDTDTMLNCDYIIDMGPGAGTLGGYVVAHGTPEELMLQEKSLTGSYLSGKREITLPHTIRQPKGFLVLKNASRNNLRNIKAVFPLGVLCGISGVSGSGKSTLIMQELVPALKEFFLNRQSDKKSAFMGTVKRVLMGDADALEGAEVLENLIVIDQTPIGRTPRSNPATYLGIFDEIRKLFASLPESQARGYQVGRFSFNVGEGRCAKCSGDGSITVSMHFLPDVVLVCSACKGTRYNNQTLEIMFRGKNIADILAMTAYEAVSFFDTHTGLRKRLQLMCDVGLEYLALGQPSTTLSGGEAQRIKLVDELAKRGHNTLYILDEPTTGLHTHDIAKLLTVFARLVDKGNSLLIIEHNLDLLKTADYIIDLGPEGGQEGGTIVAQGIPEEILDIKESYTAAYLKHLFSKKK